MRKRIVETDSLGRDYPNESFLPVPVMDEDDAVEVARIINRAAGADSPRFWKVVDYNYSLAPMFEP